MCSSVQLCNFLTTTKKKKDSFSPQHTTTMTAMSCSRCECCDITPGVYGLVRGPFASISGATISYNNTLQAHFAKLKSELRHKGALQFAGRFDSSGGMRAVVPGFGDVTFYPEEFKHLFKPLKWFPQKCEERPTVPCIMYKSYTCFRCVAELDDSPFYDTLKPTDFRDTRTSGANQPTCAI